MASKAWGWSLAAVGSMIAIGVVAYGNSSTLSGYFEKPPSDGYIVVNSPSIYTRQRLVNDRLTQTAWLKDQLEVTRNAIGQFNAINQVLVSEKAENLAVQLRLAARGTAPAGGDPPAPTKDGNAGPGGGAPAADRAPPPSSNPTNQSLPIPDRPAFRLGQTTIDLFHALNNYREEIRSEMMQTLLDDRHDIQGNTIYRLSFDATVLGGQGANDLALISVTLRHDPARYNEDYWDIYTEWAGFIQKTVNQSLDGLSKSLFERVPETRVRLMMSRFIVQELCKVIVRTTSNVRYDDRETRVECNVWAAQPNENIKRASRLLDEYVDEYIKGRDRIVRGRFRQELELSTYAPKPDELAYLYDFARRDCRSRDPYTNPQSVAAAPQTSLPTPDGKNVTVNCPIFVPPFEGLIGGLTLYELVVQNQTLLVEQLRDPPPDYAGLGQILFALTHKPVCTPANGGTICLPKEPRLADVRCAAADYIRWSLNGFGNPFTAPDERIETYLDMQTIGRMLEDCNVAVTTKEPKEKTASLLRESLNASSEVYAYNVSPRNLSRRVAASISARRALQAAIGAQGSSGPAEASANVGGARTRAEHREELELEPFIVPFARSRNAPSGKTPYATDFGWAVAPRRNDDGAKFEDGQHALAAVVSMPGWWRSAELSVTTCWVPRTALKQLANTATGGRAKAAGPTITVSPQVKDFCEAGQSASVQTELIRLPGTIQEVSRKLGFEVVQEPNLDDVQLFPQVLQVGYGGEVLLTGGRLWRSTEVTLGSQAADRIAVLPNMRGIIATFDCVRPQLPWGAPAGTRQDVEVKVWTSEGVVRHPDMVKLEYPEGRQLRGAKACPLETRLDRSQIAPGSSQPPPQNSPAASPQNPTPSSTQVPQQGLPLANSPPPSPQPTSRPQQPLPDPGPSAGR